MKKDPVDDALDDTAALVLVVTFYLAAVVGVVAVMLSGWGELVKRWVCFG